MGNAGLEPLSWARVLLWLLPRRLRSSWVVLTVASFGILAAVTLMAMGAIYSKALAEGGLRHTLANRSPVDLNAQVVVQNRPLGSADYQKLRATVEEAAAARLGRMLSDTQRSGRVQSSLPLVATADEPPPAMPTFLGQPFFLSDFEEHTLIVEGRWPQATPVSHDKGLDMEVVVGRETASSMGWEVGTQVYLILIRTDPSEKVAITVVGLAEPIDLAEEYWMKSGRSYFSTQVRDPEILVPIYVPEETFSGGMGARYPFLVGDYWWFFFLDTGVLTATTAGPAKDAIMGLEADLNKAFPRTLVFSLLKRTLTDYQRELTLARVPLFLFLSLVVVVVLYFLALVLGLLSHTRSDEASLLRSRGASMLQVSGLLALGEGVVVLLAMALGPLLALGIVRYLLLKTINPAGEGDALSIGLSADVFAMGALGGLLSLGVLAASGVSLSRLGMVEFLRARARPPAVPLLHRYYVDLLVLAVVGLIWWQTESRGGFMQRNLSGTALKEVDLSLLLGPVLVLMAAAFLVLRLLPLLLKALARLGGLLAPAWAAFALTRMARDPLPHGSLIVILMMAAALGVFGAAFQSTLSRSQREQALYDLGGELVIKGSSLPGYLQEELASIPGVQAVSPVGRNMGSLIGIDPDALPDVTWFRDDFAGKSLPELLKPLQGSREVRRGVVLPRDAVSIGVWVRVNDSAQRLSNRTLSLWLRMADASGKYENLRLGKLPSAPPSAGDSSAQDWAYMEAPLPSDEPSLEPPLSLVSVFITGGAGGYLGAMQLGTIDLDDITAKGPSTPPDGTVIEGYEEPGPGSDTWVPLPNADSGADIVERTSKAARSGRFGLTFSWREPLGNAPRGLLIPAGPFPLPGIGGPTFHVGQGALVESGGQVVPIVISDVTDYFPSIRPSSPPFVLVDMEDYTRYIRRMPRWGELNPPDELWVSLKEGAHRERTLLSIAERLPGGTSLEDRDAAAELAQRNPLAGGGWNGLTALSMFALAVAVMLALGIFSVVSVRAGRVDLTVVGALGFSRLHLALSLALERMVVAALGIAIGTAIGIWLSRWVLGFLDITARGEPVIPPMIVTAHGGLLALVFGGLLAAPAVAILLAVLSARRLRASDILRAGQ